MPLQRLRVAEPETACKCCGAVSRLCGVVDFSVGGADRLAGRKIDPYAGVPVYYHCCIRCRFVFTRCFDDWRREDFAAHIYNADYARQDPDYAGRRALGNAELIARQFPELAHAPLLDFGAGLGLLERELRARGFTGVTSFDPYADAQDAAGTAAAPPAGASRVVLAFEVFEHHPDPHALLQTLLQLLAADGAILFTTLLVTDAVLEAGIDAWWYCMPRNGHLSLFSARALAMLAGRHGLQLRSLDEGLHLLFRHAPPAWAARYQTRDGGTA
ncbi:class I SAM-dependent methyltransferase [Burkholderia plantarii]|uniref:class I SAM-dependent methyltransferase n=1 Tax=Burkholderia plantarii TaxID=41899 RepID=UPI00272A5044|nr:class I SAM-dependent methyltransferase [Burkholderia plantarii]WLE62281.1 class I SAM-dependent methyltransferase [Burkholderia plantarii]